jgi:hypothetical protein
LTVSSSSNLPKLTICTNTNTCEIVWGGVMKRIMTGIFILFSGVAVTTVVYAGEQKLQLVIFRDMYHCRYEAHNVQVL